MVFSSITFLFVFLPLFLLCYFLIPKQLKNLCLFGASLFFYFWGEPRFVLVMLASIIFNYACGLFCGAFDKACCTQCRVMKKIFLLVAIVGNLLLLFYYKYMDFAISTFNGVFSKSIPLKNIVLPIGISFFTFQGMSYVIDVYLGKVAAQKNPITVGLYISMFPQLIAGPIVRYSQIEKEIQNRTVTLSDFCEGIWRFVCGLFKKAVIANTVALVADKIFSHQIIEISCSSAWLGALCYSLQIYFDFSGYSDMAIGLAKMMGFHFLENFNFPYVARSITEFWKRWHISLSSWFKDYVYIPLGGSRTGNVYFNLFVVFLLTGIWHGAAWTFIIWGLWHGFFRILEKVLSDKVSVEKWHINVQWGGGDNII